jgi:hypothetical protein
MTKITGSGSTPKCHGSGTLLLGLLACPLYQFRDAGQFGTVHITQGMYNNMIYILPQICFQRMLVGLQLCISFLVVQLQSGSIPVRIFCLVEKWIGIVHCTVCLPSQ